ncbi:hypothetical protein TSUD_101320 [Trifolium subterraneum]|uniref:Uncharacterized protein n=1 Tax=Trifolium subterraneum TaxID=3900 RepID=A0A2Z6MML0_TRISU|nr:hypothetical protein TSUD_101320 [Trifolium subterraneum]
MPSLTMTHGPMKTHGGFKNLQRGRCKHYDGWGPNADSMSDQRVPSGILYYITPCGFICNTM